MRGRVRGDQSVDLGGYVDGLAEALVALRRLGPLGLLLMAAGFAVTIATAAGSGIPSVWCSTKHASMRLIGT